MQEAVCLCLWAGGRGEVGACMRNLYLLLNLAVNVKLLKKKIVCFLKGILSNSLLPCFYWEIVQLNLEYFQWWALPTIQSGTLTLSWYLFSYSLFPERNCCTHQLSKHLTHCSFAFHGHLEMPEGLVRGKERWLPVTWNCKGTAHTGDMLPASVLRVACNKYF